MENDVPPEHHLASARGDFALDTCRNVAHASDGPETAATEIALWFKPQELLSYQRDVDRWVAEAG